MSNAGNYGQRYWCIKTKISKNGEIYVNADHLEITLNGGLVCRGGFRADEEREDQKRVDYTVLGIAAGKWESFFAASCLDGHAVAVEFWEGEVVR